MVESTNIGPAATTKFKKSYVQLLIYEIRDGSI